MTTQNTAAALQGGETSYLDYDNTIEFEDDVFATNTAIKGNSEDVDKAVHDELAFDLESTEKREADPEVTAAVERLKHRWVYRVVKRTTDIVFSGAVLILFCWLFAIIAIAIKIDDPKGPVFFKQKRMGRTKDGKQTEFEMHKFRSMISGAEDRLTELKEFNEKTGPVFKIKNDPRITRVGRLLRKTSLDELPQFINVLRSEMTIVSPRPALPAEARTYDERQKQRLLVKPGITCYWQTRLDRDSITFDEWVDLDLLYIKKCGIWTDFKQVVKTVLVVLTAQGN